MLLNRIFKIQQQQGNNRNFKFYYSILLVNQQAESMEAKAKDLDIEISRCKSEKLLKDNVTKICLVSDELAQKIQAEHKYDQRCPQFKLFFQSLLQTLQSVGQTIRNNKEMIKKGKNGEIIVGVKQKNGKEKYLLLYDKDAHFEKLQSLLTENQQIRQIIELKLSQQQLRKKLQDYFNKKKQQKNVYFLQKHENLMECKTSNLKKFETLSFQEDKLKVQLKLQKCEQSLSQYLKDSKQRQGEYKKPQGAIIQTSLTDYRLKDFKDHIFVPLTVDKNTKQFKRYHYFDSEKKYFERIQSDANWRQVVSQQELPRDKKCFFEISCLQSSKFKCFIGIITEQLRNDRHVYGSPQAINYSLFNGNVWDNGQDLPVGQPMKQSGMFRVLLDMPNGDIIWQADKKQLARIKISIVEKFKAKRIFVSVTTCHMGDKFKFIQ